MFDRKLNKYKKTVNKNKFTQADRKHIYLGLQRCLLSSQHSRGEWGQFSHLNNKLLAFILGQKNNLAIIAD